MSSSFEASLAKNAHRASSGSLAVCLYLHPTFAYNLGTCEESPQIPSSLGDTFGKNNVLARSEDINSGNTNEALPRGIRTRSSDPSKSPESLKSSYCCGCQTNRAIQPKELPCFLPAERDVIKSRTTEPWPDARTSTNFVRVPS